MVVLYSHEPRVTGSYPAAKDLDSNPIDLHPDFFPHLSANCWANRKDKNEKGLDLKESNLLLLTEGVFREQFAHAFSEVRSVHPF